MSKRANPNFLLGGTAAGGTSFLSAILIQHPQIYLPKKMRPEPHYFYKSWEYEKGLDNYLSTWFSDVPSQAKSVGERSSSYLFGGASVAARVRKEYPNMKFIFTLRNPIERCWANYRYTVLQGLEELSFEEALFNEEQRVRAQGGIWAEIQPYNYTGRGFYAEQIKEYLNFFPRENFLILKSELLSSQTDVELEKIFDFLELAQKKLSYVRPPNHTSVRVLNPGLQVELRQHFGTMFDKIIEAIRKNEDLKKFEKIGIDKIALAKLVSNLTKEKDSMSAKARCFLTAKFANDIEALASLVDFSTSDWV